MKTELVERIRRERGLPIIGVIGATFPSEGYTRETGIAVGYALREFVERRGGTLFTGGMHGVGVDTHTGIMKYCIEAVRSGDDQGLPDDRFFVLVPEYDVGQLDAVGMTIQSTRARPYVLPSAHVSFGHLSPRGYLDVVRAGSGMGERREYVAGIADALVAVNGGFGTLDEAFNAIAGEVPVVALANSGGAAAILGAIKSGNVSDEIERRLAKARSPPTSSVDASLIYSAMSPQQVTERLDSLLG